MRKRYVFYDSKKEHYPVSDAFVQKYQQQNRAKNTYIGWAVITGHPICCKGAEPNQKWHLLESYYNDKIKKEKFNLDKPVCEWLSFRCPELILWMAEAADAIKKIITWSMMEEKMIKELELK